MLPYSGQCGCNLTWQDRDLTWQDRDLTWQDRDLTCEEFPVDGEDVEDTDGLQ